MKFRIIYYLSILVVITPILVFSNDKNIESENKKLSKLTESSEIIVIGQVVNTRSEWNENKDRILTKISIRADEYIKGNNSNQDLIIVVPGGEIGDIGEIYSHMPKFEMDEEVLLFVKKDRSNNFIVNRGKDGKYKILINENTGKKTSRSTIISKVKSNIKSIIND